MESKIDQIVLLEEKLNEKDEYCYNLEDTVAELTHRSRGMEQVRIAVNICTEVLEGNLVQANSDLIARLQSTPARSTSGIPVQIKYSCCNDTFPILFSNVT